MCVSLFSSPLLWLLPFHTQHIRNKTPVHSYLLYLICIRTLMNRYNIIYMFVSLFGLRLNSHHKCYTVVRLLWSGITKKCILQFQKHASIRRRWLICLWYLCLIRNKMKMLRFWMVVICRFVFLFSISFSKCHDKNHWFFCVQRFFFFSLSLIHIGCFLCDKNR